MKTVYDSYIILAILTHMKRNDTISQYTTTSKMPQANIGGWKRYETHHNV